MIRKTVKLGLVIAIVASAIIGATFIFRAGRARRPLSEKEAVELAREYVEGEQFLIRFDNIELRFVALYPIERMVELSPPEQDMLAEHDELPDKIWVVEFEIEYHVMGVLPTDGTGAGRVVIDAYTGEKLSLITLSPWI